MAAPSQRKRLPAHPHHQCPPPGRPRPGYRDGGPRPVLWPSLPGQPCCVAAVVSGRDRVLYVKQHLKPSVLLEPCQHQDQDQAQHPVSKHWPVSGQPQNAPQAIGSLLIPVKLCTVAVLTTCTHRLQRSSFKVDTPRIRCREHLERAKPQDLFAPPN